jgi:hypothetical protein
MGVVRRRERLSEVKVCAATRFLLILVPKGAGLEGCSNSGPLKQVRSPLLLALLRYTWEDGPQNPVTKETGGS